MVVLVLVTQQISGKNKFSPLFIFFHIKRARLELGASIINYIIFCCFIPPVVLNNRCECTQGYTGPLCQHNLNECESSPCVHGICVDQEDGFRCFCQPGILCFLIYYLCFSLSFQIDDNLFFYFYLNRIRW